MNLHSTHIAMQRNADVNDLSNLYQDRARFYADVADGMVCLHAGECGFDQSHLNVGNIGLALMLRLNGTRCRCGLPGRWFRQSQGASREPTALFPKKWSARREAKREASRPTGTRR